MVHLDDCTKRAEYDMRSNLIQLNEISLSLERATLHDPQLNPPSASDPSLHNESSRNLSSISDGNFASRLKADMEYILKELGQTRRDIEEARADVSLFHEDIVMTLKTDPIYR